MSYMSSKQMECQKIGDSGQIGLLQVPQIFTYSYFEKNRYQITNEGMYECICNNGWIKLYTLHTRVYWHAQNEFQHRVADWKFHVSVKHEDLKKAWDLCVGVFKRMKCRAGMKVVYLKQANCPQVGRQITLYIVKYSREFQNSSFANDYDVSIADEHSQDFWIQMVCQIENVLQLHEIQSNGLADGDLKIGNYVSLRNQAFVLGEQGNFEYPKNEEGWNPMEHEIPFDIVKMLKKVQKNLEERQEDGNEDKIQRKGRQQKSVDRPMYYFGLPIMFVSIGLFCYKKYKGH